MLITRLDLPGPVVVDIQARQDERGIFARTFDRQTFAEAGLEVAVEQVNLSFNNVAGTLRGLHYQLEPSAEAKLVRCTRGAIVDVAVDMRPESSSYLQHVMVELTTDNRRALYVPRGFAHGYQTLEDGSEVHYQVSRAYDPDLERGVRHDDPQLAIPWPLPVTGMSDKDTSWSLLERQHGD